MCGYLLGSSLPPSLEGHLPQQQTTKPSGKTAHRCWDEGVSSLGSSLSSLPQHLAQPARLAMAVKLRTLAGASLFSTDIDQHLSTCKYQKVRCTCCNVVAPVLARLVHLIDLHPQQGTYIACESVLPAPSHQLTFHKRHLLALTLSAQHAGHNQANSSSKAEGFTSEFLQPLQRLQTPLAASTTDPNMPQLSTEPANCSDGCCCSW